MRRRGLKWQLVTKSTDAFILALETVNRLTSQYKVEAYCILLCNAWELLLKAKVADLEKRNSAIYAPKKRGQPRKTISADKAIRRVFKENDPVRTNLEEIFEYRDQSVHPVISSPGAITLSLLQAAAFNYHKCLNEWFRVELGDKLALGLLSFHFDHDEMIEPISYLGSKPMAHDIAVLQEFERRAQSKYEELGYPIEFAASVKYEVGIAKSISSGNDTVSSRRGSTGSIFVEKPRDSAKTHPYRMKELCAELNGRAEIVNALGRELSVYDIRCMVKRLNATSNPDYFYQSEVPNSPKTYSLNFANRLASEIERNADFVEKSRDLARRRP